MRTKRKMRSQRASTGQMAKVLAASLVLSPALYMASFDHAYVQAVTTVSYKAPLVSQPLPDYRTVVGTPLTVDLNAYFDGIGSYSATVSNPLNVGSTGYATTINQNMLTFTNDRLGTATVTVTGTAANGGTVVDAFDVLVIPDSLDKDNNGNIDISEIVTFIGSRPFTKEMLNDTLNFIAPQKMTAPNSAPQSKDTTVTIYKNSPLTLSPSELFGDDDPLTIDTFSLSAAAYATASLANNQLTFNGLEHGALTMDMSVKDGRGGKASNRFDVIVGNRSPIFTGSNLAVTQNTYFNDGQLLDLKSIFSDPDGDALQFNQVQVTQAGNLIDVQQTSDHLKIFGAAVGTATVSATANDSYGGSVIGSFNVTVSAATYGNHAPTVVSTITDKSTSLTNGAVTISNIKSYFIDVEDPSLSYMASLSSPGIVTLSMPSGNLVISPLSKGTATVTIKATDSSNAYAEMSFNVEVANSAPVVAATIANQATSMGQPALTFDLASSVNPYFIDPDNDSITYTGASSSMASVATVVVISGQLLKVTQQSKGTSTITITATDSVGAQTNMSFDVVVSNAQPQYTSGLDAITIDHTGVSGPPYPAIMIDNLATAFSDADSDTLTFTAASSNESLAATTVSGNSLTITPNGDVYGKTVVTVKAEDGHGGSATKSFDLTYNKPPTIIGTISSMNIMHNQEASMSVSYFKDEESDSLTYSATTDLVGALTVRTSLSSGGTAYIAGLPRGTNVVTLTVTDTFGASVTSKPFDIIVSNNLPVYVTGSLPMTTISQSVGTAEISLAGSFTDADSDDVITYTSSFSNSDLADVNVSGNILSITPNGYGIATVTITATDSYGGSAQTTFELMISTP
ncbi:Ig-like domain-containing protein [Paenibacillus agricola]|uniref:Uncharacterized protein n=1 Tax=Paenibacillus agricola TaxID=2716264 RepID=A0ABX0J115_9BACL|nr:Ig-like domain-containing protein [Paenibacillus agricola]NHN29526.1 hypothetical protein [Paenibacillus agricola]